MFTSQRITFAFVDDTKVQHLLLKAIADKIGIFDLILSAQSGKDLISKLEEMFFLPEICILDIHMPEMDGIETARILKSKFPSMKLFGYSASEDKEDVSQMLAKGVVEVFSKLDPNAMLEKIHALITAKSNLA